LGEKRNAFRVLVRDCERKKPRGRPRHRWKDTIEVHFKEIGCEGVDWIYLVHDGDRWWAVVNTVMNFRVP
jgi:hypothetical protein